MVDNECLIEPNNYVTFSLLSLRKAWFFFLRPTFYQIHVSVADLKLLNRLYTTIYWRTLFSIHLTEEIVTRYCYNTTSLTKSWYPKGCHEYHTADTCYCNKEACNSQEAVRATFGFLLLATLLASFFIFRF